MLTGKNPAEMSDAELVALALVRRDDFLHLVNKYQKPLFVFIRRLTNVAPEEAEDILQEVFLKIYLNLNDFDQSLKFSSWAYRIARNTVVSHYRARQARPRSADSLPDDGVAENLPADFFPEKEIDRKLLRRRVNKIFKNLKLKYREVLILKFIEEKSYEEIADVLQCPMGTVASLMHKAKKEFRNLWESSENNK